jgi:hypothetical protein
MFFLTFLLLNITTTVLCQSGVGLVGMRPPIAVAHPNNNAKPKMRLATLHAHSPLPEGFHLEESQLPKSYALNLIDYQNINEINLLNSIPSQAYSLGIVQAASNKVERMMRQINSTKILSFKWMGRMYNTTICITGGKLKGINSSSIGAPGHDTFEMFQKHQLKYSIKFNYLHVSIYAYY